MEGAVGAALGEERGVRVKKSSERVIYGPNSKMDWCFWVSVGALVSNMEKYAALPK